MKKLKLFTLFLVIGILSSCAAPSSIKYLNRNIITKDNLNLLTGNYDANLWNYLAPLSIRLTNKNMDEYKVSLEVINQKYIQAKLIHTQKRFFQKSPPDSTLTKFKTWSKFQPLNFEYKYVELDSLIDTRKVRGRIENGFFSVRRKVYPVGFPGIFFKYYESKLELALTKEDELYLEAVESRFGWAFIALHGGHEDNFYKIYPKKHP